MESYEGFYCLNLQNIYFGEIIYIDDREQNDCQKNLLWVS